MGRIKIGLVISTFLEACISGDFARTENGTQIHASGVRVKRVSKCLILGGYTGQNNGFFRPKRSKNPGKLPLDRQNPEKSAKMSDFHRKWGIERFPLEKYRAIRTGRKVDFWQNRSFPEVRKPLICHKSAGSPRVRDKPVHPLFR